MKAVNIIMKKHRRYGGAERPFDCNLVNAPSSEMMAGRKSGRDAKLTLVLKFMVANR
jgi:hypothetical protein